MADCADSNPPILCCFSLPKSDNSSAFSVSNCPPKTAIFWLSSLSLFCNWATIWVRSTHFRFQPSRSSVFFCKASSNGWCAKGCSNDPHTTHGWPSTKVARIWDASAIFWSPSTSNWAASPCFCADSNSIEGPSSCWAISWISLARVFWLDSFWVIWVLLSSNCFSLSNHCWAFCFCWLHCKTSFSTSSTVMFMRLNSNSVSDFQAFQVAVGVSKDQFQRPTKSAMERFRCSSSVCRDWIFSFSDWAKCFFCSSSLSQSVWVRKFGLSESMLLLISVISWWRRFFSSSNWVDWLVWKAMFSIKRLRCWRMGMNLSAFSCRS